MWIDCAKKISHVLCSQMVAATLPQDLRLLQAFSVALVTATALIQRRLKVGMTVFVEDKHLDQSVRLDRSIPIVFKMADPMVQTIHRDPALL